MGKPTRIYPVLRFISITLGVFGMFFVVTGITGAITAHNALRHVSYDVALLTASDAWLQQLSVGLYWFSVGDIPASILISGLVSGVGSLLISGLIKLMIDIEENTRMTYRVLLRQAYKDDAKELPKSVWEEDESRKVLPRLGWDMPKPAAVRDAQGRAVRKPSKWDMGKP